jgi:hypothetical protein
MTPGVRFSGFTLVVAGMVGMVFFWLTDSRWGLARRWVADVHLIDSANEVLPGTVVGMAGSAIVLLVGLWLMVRRAG